METNLLKMLTLLLNLLTIFSYTYYFLHPTLSEAKTPSKNGFTFDLIHRYYHPNSPSYNSSISRLELFRQVFHSSASRYKQIKSEQNPIQGEVDTILTPGLGDYLMEVNIGTPPKKLSLVAVTGTDLTWVQCQPCNFCYQQNNTIFNPQSSNSYQTLPCNAKFCNGFGELVHFSCDQTENICRYRSSYGNSSSVLQGFMGNDTFYFDTPDGKNQVPFDSIAFGCGHQQTGEFDTDSAGVVGLGNGPLSLISQMGPQISYTFTYCLTFITSTSSSKFRFGGDPLQKTTTQYSPTAAGDDPLQKTAIQYSPTATGGDPLQKTTTQYRPTATGGDPLQKTTTQYSPTAGGDLPQNPSNQSGKVTIPFSTNNGLSTFYILGLNGITIGETSISIYRQIILDIGTTLTYLNPSTFNNLEALVSQAIGANPISNNPIVEDDLTCYDSTNTPLTPPNIIFHFMGGYIEFSPNNMFFQIDTFVCLTIVKSQRDGDPLVLGNMAQVNFEVEIDQQRETVNFTPAECALQNV